MTLTSSAAVLHYADLARSPTYALELASRMVASSRASHDSAATHRWVRRYIDIQRAVDGR